MADEGAEPKPSIAYVDEREDARGDFFSDAFNSELFEDIFVLAPEPTLPEMLDRLFELRIDALVSDFQLSEAAPVDYDGEKLISAFLDRRADFPCFIQTSFDNDALQVAGDVNRVYSKNPKAEAGARQHFFQRINLQIDRHREMIVNWKAELADLLVIDRAELSSAQIDRLIELDTAIERNLGADDPLSKQAKQELFGDSSLFNRREQLIDETEKLIQKIKNAIDG